VIDITITHRMMGRSCPNNSLRKLRFLIRYFEIARILASSLEKTASGLCHAEQIDCTEVAQRVSNLLPRQRDRIGLVTFARFESL